MIINHKRKFVFICVPKTGSTTLSKHFIKTDNPSPIKAWVKEDGEFGWSRDVT